MSLFLIFEKEFLDLGSALHILQIDRNFDFTKMKKTFLIGQTSVLSNRASKAVIMIFGLIYFSVGASKFSITHFSLESWFNLVFGMLWFGYGMIYFCNTPISPRIQIDDKVISFRHKLFGKTSILRWSDIQSIHYDSYELIFNLANETKSFSYQTNSSTSLKIKKSIRTIAEQYQIGVTGG